MWRMSLVAATTGSCSETDCTVIPDPSGPTVTICIPSYNRADLVSETLDSLVAQNYPDWEAIVVDDGSTDDSQTVVNAYAARDPRVRLLSRNRAPKGACTCRNIAVQHAQGRFLLFLDTDDLLAPFCLEQRVAVLQSDPALDFAVFPMLIFSERPEDADRLWNVETGEDDLERVLRLDPICQTTGTLWRVDSFRRLGGWHEELGIWQDIELHIRAFAGKLGYVKRFDLRPDVYLRETLGSLSRGDYHSRGKLESRAAVARLAARSLREGARSDMISQLRYICSSVIYEAATAGHLDIAADLRKWAEHEGVLTSGERRRLRFAELARASRLDRITPVRTLRDSLMRTFAARTTLGQVRQPRVPDPPHRLRECRDSGDQPSSHEQQSGS